MSNFKAKCTKFDFRLGSAPALPQTTQLYLTGPTSKGKEKEEEGEWKRITLPCTERRCSFDYWNQEVTQYQHTPVIIIVADCKFNCHKKCAGER